MLKNFKEYLDEGVARRRASDIFRAKSLIKNSENRKNFLGRILQGIEVKEEDANYVIEQVYDVLIELIRAKMFIDGFESSGNNAHEAEVSYLRELDYLNEELSSMNELRIFRNGIKYYGKRYTKEQAENAVKFMNRLFLKLKTSLNIK